MKRLVMTHLSFLLVSWFVLLSYDVLCYMFFLTYLRYDHSIKDMLVV